MEFNFNTRNLSANEIAAEQQAYLVKVFGWMGAGLITTAIVSAYVVNVVGQISGMAFLIAFIAEIFLVVRIAKSVEKMSATAATATFIGYSALNGFTLSGIFLIYTAQSIVSTFFIASSIFIIMAAFGYFTKIDLTKMGSFMMMGLFGIIIAMIVNWFIGSNAIMLAISVLGVIIFTGLTAYDVQKIMRMRLLTSVGTNELETQQAIRGALTLYLDFLNLFIMLLHLVGIARD